MAKDNKEKIGRAQFVDLIHSELNGTYNKKDVNAIAQAAISVIFSCMKKHQEIGFTGVLSLTPKLRAARTGRNPQKPTEVIDIPEKWSVGVKVGKDLSEAMNNKKK